MKCDLAAVVFVALLTPSLAAQTPEDPRAPSTIAMAERLREICSQIDVMKNPYANGARAEHLLKEKPPGDFMKRFAHEMSIAHELLRSGDSRRAIVRYKNLRRAALENSRLFKPKVFFELSKFLGIAHLREGEQENCLALHSPEACLLPLRGNAVHKVSEPAQRAKAEYIGYLSRRPGDLSAVWLMNIASMALGEGPEKIPALSRVPAKSFESAFDVGSFPNMATECGLDVIGLSGGCVVDDLDGDGLLDIVCSSWGFDDQIRFFHNNGDGSFDDRTLAAGLEGITGGLNLCHADYDNDGDLDIYVLRGAWLNIVGRIPDSLLRNDGGRFVDVTEEAGLLGEHPTQTAGWADFDHDGFLDLFVGGESFEAQLHPCQLFRNRGDGTFENIASKVGANVEGYVKGVACGDYDGDGDIDIYLSRLFEKNVLLRHSGVSEDGSFRFEDVAEEAGVQDPKNSFPTWFFDYDNDGDLDLFVSGYDMKYYERSEDAVAAEYMGLGNDAESPRLYRNDGEGRFEDVTEAAGLDSPLFTMGCNFGDLDNDGHLDFYLGTGTPNFTALIPNRMFRNDGQGGFQDVTTSGGFGHLQKGHGVAFSDLDNDGDQDIYAVLGGAYSGDVFRNALFVNPGHQNHFVTLELRGRRANRCGLGARLHLRVREGDVVRDIHRVVGTGGSFGSSTLRAQIGLGSSSTIEELHVLWPGSLTRQTLQGLEVDAFYVIEEGAEAATRLEVPSFSLTSPR